MNLNEENTEKKTANKSSILITILSFLLVVSIVFIIILLMKQRPAETSNDTTITEQSKPVEKLEDSINIPGYTMLSFKAGELNQQVTIPNPIENTCWFNVSLVLGDGTVLWTSDMVAPGETSENIVLSKPLEKGDYPDAMLKFECFADEAGTQALNGAETELTISVK